jgi:outer membrane protein TolC
VLPDRRPSDHTEPDPDQCIAAAIAHDGRSKAAGHGVEIADARRGQALSSRYPSLSARLTATRFDEDPNFVFPASSIDVPASSFTIPPMVMTLPANAFGPGFPPVNVPLPIPGSTLPVPAQVFHVPEQDVRLMDQTLYSGTLNAMYALYTGGLAGARIAQARAGVDVARHERRQTAAELAFDVTRAYYGVVLAHKLRAVAAETYERMKVTLDLTESLYKAGSGRVKKTDFLRHTAMVETIASMVTEFEAAERSARAALAMLIGWTGPGDPALATDDFVGTFAAPAMEAVRRAGRESADRPDRGRLGQQAGVRPPGWPPPGGLFANPTP